MEGMEEGVAKGNSRKKEEEEKKTEMGDQTLT